MKINLIKISWIWTFVIGSLLASSCTNQIKSGLVNSLGDSMGSSDSLVFTGEEDPELIRDSLPFSIKLMETLIEESPDNPKLRLALVKMLTLYANQWLDFEAKRIEEDDYDKSEHLLKRANRLYLRAKNQGQLALDMVPHFDANDLSGMRKKDAPYLTWTALAWMAWMSTSDHLEDSIDLDRAIGYVDKAIELDPELEDGLLMEVKIQLNERNLTPSGVVNPQTQNLFSQLTSLTNEKKCSPYLTWATGVSVKKQDKQEFTKMLDKAMSVPDTEVKSYTLSNALCKEKVIWYRGQIDDLFL